MVECVRLGFWSVCVMGGGDVALVVVCVEGRDGMWYIRW